VTLVSNAKLARLAKKKLTSWDIRLLRAIEAGKGDWVAFTSDVRYERAIDRLIDWDLLKSVVVDGTDTWVLTPAGKIVCEGESYAKDRNRM